MRVSGTRSASFCGAMLGFVGLVVGCLSDSGGATDAETGGTGSTGTATGVSTNGNTLSGTGNATGSGGGTLDDTAGSADTLGTGPGTGTTTGPMGCADHPNGDFHLVAGHPFGDVATWHDGDPIVDVDGDMRPMVDGSSDVAGADIGP